MKINTRRLRFALSRLVVIIAVVIIIVIIAVWRLPSLIKVSYFLDLLVFIDSKLIQQQHHYPNGEFCEYYD